MTPGPGGGPPHAFGLEVVQNPYRSIADTGMAVVLRVTARSPAEAAAPAPSSAGVVVLVDCSSSMGYPQAKMTAAKQATRAAIDTIRDGSSFAIVAGTDTARMVYPERATTAVAGDSTRAAAKRATGHLYAGGGTAMGRWLRLADQLLAPYPDLVRHVILLTDGRNEHETPEQLEEVLAGCAGNFVCDARGIGEDWDHRQLLRIASVLRGTAEAIGQVDELVADFRSIMDRAMGKQVADLRIRLNTAPGVRVRSVRQETPTLADLTEHATVLDDRTTEFYTGSWTGDESRDFLVDLAIGYGSNGDRPPLEEEVRAARVDLLMAGERCADPWPIVLRWTDDPVAPTRIEPLVARHLGQEELGDAVAAGCDALEAGDRQTAEAQLGLAVGLAERLGNTEVLHRLAGLVEITGDSDRPVRLKADWTRSALLRVAVSSVMVGGVEPPWAARQPRPAPQSPLAPEPAPGTGAADQVCPCGRISPPEAMVCDACRRPFREPAAGGEGT
ncbi:vWA domain-containing protein [Plantactinospora sp. KLBMP9567]|uniref:vWA domain-containing protein n=1 Tax=Plantactinospora sp. KLBMP9567 TaxID=3085900 RepID=UPI0029812982|nr:VWA domain-containing protein [Plantactinospora sp. KLBMP9567]MDW5323941.1 VWA domain-containing protein [Plantactinospora sp. KLBMP9567]